MSKLAFVFPGQGAQKVGMGKDFYDRYDVAKRLFKEADEALGYSIMNMCFDGPEDDLKLTANTQPAILTMSVIANEILKENGIQPEITGGHSLGEYSALVAAGVLNFKDAVALVHKRGAFMQEAVPVGEGGMAAIIGVERDRIVEICAGVSAESPVQAVNFNCPGQIVVSGEVAAVEKCCELAKAKGAKRAMLLPVSAPFHCELLIGAGEKLAKELENVEIGDMQIPVITNVTADYVGSKEDIKPLLIKQVSSSVLWEDTIRKMLADGVDTFVEVGPGKALSGFIKKITKDVNVYNVEDMASLEKTLEGLNA